MSPVSAWRDPLTGRPLAVPAKPAGRGSSVNGGEFLMLALASGIPFNGMFLYVLSAPVFLGEHLKLGPVEVLADARDNTRVSALPATGGRPGSGTPAQKGLVPKRASLPPCGATIATSEPERGNRTMR